MRILLLPVGSHGDVHPLLGLAVGLRSRGHDVTFATIDSYQPLVEKAGLHYRSLGTDEEFKDSLKDPNLWHPIKGFKAVMERGVFPMMERTYNLITRDFSPADTLLVAAAISFGARIAQETHGFRLATTMLQPAPLRTAYDHPFFSKVFIPSWTPKPLKRAFWSFGDFALLDPVLKPAVNGLRAKFGLKPVSHLLDQWWLSPDLVLGLFPEWFAPVQPDWPPQLRLTGFPLFDEQGITPMPEDLLHFLRDNPSPIAFTPGSANVHGRQFFADSAAACQILNRPGLLLTRHPEQIPSPLPPTVKHVPYAPFSQLLPHCAALVHHGGIGTTAQALRAACPQLITPLSHDQPDNAIRVHRLGAGTWLSPTRYTPSRAASTLHELLSSPKTAESCRALANHFTHSDPITYACHQIEQLTLPRPA